MTQDEILDTCTGVLRDVLGDDSVTLQPQTRREDVPNWDSLAYVNFIVALEMRIGIRFAVGEIEAFRNLGDIVQSVERKIAA